MGAPLDKNQQGAAFLYFRNGTEWDRQAKKLDVSSYPGTKWQGISVALNADGSTAIIGGNQDNDRMGASWIFAPGPKISISLKNYSSEFCKGVVKTTFSYDKTEGDPNLYSIIWDQKDLAGGLINVTDQVLPPGSFEITMPTSLAGGVYNGALKVHNSSTGESSTGSIFTLVIPEPPKISPITGSGTVLVGSNTTLSTSTATSSGVWSSSAPAIATVNATNGQVTGIAEGSVIITYIYPEQCTGLYQYGKF